jgi:hypothetical protein
MFKHLQNVSGVITVLTLYELFRVRPLQTKYNQLGNLAFQMGKDNLLLKDQRDYLIHRLIEHEIGLDEFDLLVLTHGMK